MSAQQHTPVPYCVEHTPDGTFIVPMDHKRNPIAEILCTGRSDEANAEFIARACNAHAELLALCRRALEQSARVHPDFTDALRAAIAKADPS